MSNVDEQRKALLVGILKEQYGFGEASVEQLQSKDTKANFVYQLDLPDKSLIVKFHVHRPDIELDLEERAIQLLEQSVRLRDMGVSLPHIYQAGNLLRVPVQIPTEESATQIQGYVSVYSVLPGHDYIQNETNIQSLARVHRIALEELQALEIPEPHVPKKIPFKERNYETWKNMLTDLKANESYKQLALELELLYEGNEREYEKLVSDGGMPELDLSMKIFTDFHPWNALYNEDGVTGIFDFEFLQLGGLTDLTAPLTRVARSGRYIDPNSKDIERNMSLYLDAFFEDQDSPIVQRFKQQMPWMNNIFKERLLQNAIYDAWSDMQKRGSGGTFSASRNLTLYHWLDQNKDFFLRYK